MRHIWSIATGAALSLVLAACGQSSNPAPGVQVESENGGDTLTVTSPEGGGTVIQSGAAVAAPDDLPEFVRLYPGMSITSVMNNSMQGISTGGMIFGHSSDSFDEVAAFYRAHAQSLGFSGHTEMGGQDGLIISAGDNTNNRSLAVSIGNAEGGGVDISLQYSSGTQ